MKPRIPFANHCLSLPERCRIPTAPTPVAVPALIAFNEALAVELGLGDWAQAWRAELAEVFSGNLVPEGAAAVALAYAGHQFGGFVPQLGDGRALLMGDLVDIIDGPFATSTSSLTDVSSFHVLRPNSSSTSCSAC